jgi:hypothetical protein
VVHIQHLFSSSDVLVPSSPTLTCAQPQRFRASVQQLCTDKGAERFNLHIRRGLQVLLHLERVLVLVPSSPTRRSPSGVGSGGEAQRWPPLSASCLSYMRYTA